MKIKRIGHIEIFPPDYEGETVIEMSSRHDCLTLEQLRELIKALEENVRIIEGLNDDDCEVVTTYN